MRVVIAKKLLSAIGGSEAQARALARALGERGHDVTVVGLRPASRRPGIPAAVYEAPPGPVELREGRVRYVFVPVRGGRIGALVDGVLPTALVSGGTLRDAVDGAEIVHSIAREWVGPLERAAREAGAAFVETPLVHPGQRFSGDGAADIARYRRDDAVIALTEWEAHWYRTRGARSVHVTGLGPILAPLPDVPMDGATVLFVGRKERYKGYHALRDAAEIVWRSRPEARFVAIGQDAWNARFERRRRDERWVDRADNVGKSTENYLIRDVATIVADVVEGSEVTFADGAGTDLRNYRVTCDLIAAEVPEFQPAWTVRRGVEQLVEAYQRFGLSIEGFGSERHQRIKRIRALQEAGKLDNDLRWVAQ